MSPTFSPLVLTLKLDRATFARFNHLRQQYFPPDKNIVPAHITLFHALPGEQEATIQHDLQKICAIAPPLLLQFPKLRFLGRGVAVEVACPELVQLHQQCAQTWSNWLTRQDRQGYRSHLTIQNKVPETEARLLYEQLAKDWTPCYGSGDGLLLWHYQGGPWSLVNEFLFAASDSPLLP
jgi:hypothetical protein